MMKPHMIENHIHYVFAFKFNHVGFTILWFIKKLRLTISIMFEEVFISE